jgi:hypothetical protein
VTDSADELIAFILAQYDKDERVAKAASQDAWSDRYGEFRSRGGEQFVHILGHDPAYVLADIASKRRIVAEIVDEANSLDAQVDQEFGTGSRDEATKPYLGDQLARLLALPYASRDGYKEWWRP